jgi:two-component system alkaline phosphatase synthesis response regulator PhoP
LGKRILVVDDEETIVRLVSYNLEKEGFCVITADDGLSALEQVKRNSPDLLILDIMLPSIDGLEVCRRLRQENIRVPIIMLTARDTEIDKVLGLELGADDYVTKPFSPRELVARVKAILRRSDQENDQGQKSEIMAIRDLSIDLQRYEVRVRGEVITLTPKEFELLRFLMRNVGRVLTRDVLLDKVWDYEFSGDTRIVDVHISRLRDKIELDPKSPIYIETVRGIGYRLKEK